ncbi:phosphoadenosine phosphosulfate reductase family protein [Priestia endophytica]
MNNTQLLETYTKEAEFHFTLKKKYDKEKDKESAKLHKNKMEDLDRRAEGLLHQMDVNKLYLEQVNPEVKEEVIDGKKKKKTIGSRASRSVRYYHFWQKDRVTLEEKERWGIDLIKLALSRAKRPVVSCSFGIDSIIVLYLTRKALIELGRDPSEILVVWNDTLNEFPEVRQYAKKLEAEWNLNLMITKPKKPLKKVIKEHGGVDSSYFFTRKGDRKNGRPLSEKCCGVLKHEPMQRAIRENNWDLQINGVRADESSQRLRACLRDGEYFYSIAEWKAYSCKPIAWWAEKDIWEYVEQENIPYNSLYEKNMIKKYPVNLDEILHKNKKKLLNSGLDFEALKEEQLQTVTRMQAILLQEIGFDMFNPRTGCMQCPIAVKYGYLQWMRTYHPKVFNSMIHALEYGKALLDMIPDDVKEEIKAFTGIDVTEENAHEYLKEILQSKPCVFDKFN